MTEVKDLRLDLVRPEKIAQDIRRATMKVLARIVAKHVKAEAPVGTRFQGYKGKLSKKGKQVKRKRLKSTVQSRVLNGGDDAAVFAISRHAHLIEHGTKSHMIQRRYAKALSIGGHLVGANAVRHPGFPANPFLARGAEESKGEIAAALRNIAE
jgi:hypothetical protein